MQSDKRIGIVPMTAGLMMFIDDQNARISLGQKYIAKCHTHGTTSDYQIIR